MKLTKMDDSGAMKPTGKYHKFENIHYAPKGWEKIVADWYGCKKICDRMNRCGAFSYRSYDSVCNLAGDSVKYDTDFNYYERNMPPPHDPEEEKLISGDDEEEEGEDNKHLLEGPSPEEIEAMKAQKVSDLMVNKAKASMKDMKQAHKELAEESAAVSETEDKEAELRTDQAAGTKEGKQKSDGVAAIEKINMETGKTQGMRAIDVDEAQVKAKARIQSAFQEGYQKGEQTHSSSYNDQVKEIANKNKKSADEHSEKIVGLAKSMKKEAKEKEQKEVTHKEVTAKEMEKEAKANAVMEVRVNSIKDSAAYDLEAATKKRVNVGKLNTIEELRGKRQQREKSRKTEKFQAIADQKQKEHDKKMANEQEKKEKVRHEQDVKEEERKHVEYARKIKEQSHKEIDKKEHVNKRKIKAAELEQKLENAKKGAEELAEKHKERTAKVGKCEERRVKGQYLTYAYARTATFASAMNPSTAYGADAAYNGMVRIQNGLGQLKQNGYFKFSATGNKIVDEEQSLLTSLIQTGESAEATEAKQISVAITNSVVDNTKNNEIIEKGKVMYVARRRWVDRRRRWAVEPVISERRRDPLASRRRELSERRRRSTAALEASVSKAVLKVFKFGGPAGKLDVRAVNCNFERATLNWATATSLAIPESSLMVSAETFLQTAESAQLGAEDAAQTGYWKQDRKDHQKLGESASELPTISGGDSGDRRRSSPPVLPPLPVVQQPAEYVADRRRYIDRRRRFATPADLPGAEQPNEPGPTASRRRFVGMTAGSVFAPDNNNVWVEIPLSANIVGVMRASNKMCLEISGGSPSAPIILGSELSTNKPFLLLNIAGQNGARRRRCSQVVALQELQGKPSGL